MNNPLLTRTECAALRGMAIIGIMLHNYCHWLGFAVKENEFTYTVSKCSGLARVLADADMHLPIHLLSFFGHYGVPVFLFLSAYGLVMKYENTAGGKPSKRQTAFVSFLTQHYRKLFDMMIVGFVAFIIFDAITPGRHRYEVMDIIGQMFMFNNLMSSPDRIIWPGPYWFFGLMMQLYIVYRLMIWRRSLTVPVVLVVLCWLLQAFCDPEGDTLNRLRYNCVGGMLPFVAGIVYARRGKELGRAAWATTAMVGSVMVLFMSFNFHTWLWIPLVVCAVGVGTVKTLPRQLCVWLAWMGNISAAIFVMHPLLRKIFIPVSRAGDVYAGLLLYVIASVAVAWFYHESRGLFGNRHK